MLGLAVGLALAELVLTVLGSFHAPEKGVRWWIESPGVLGFELAARGRLAEPVGPISVALQLPAGRRRAAMVGASTVHGAQVRPFSTIPGFLEPLLGDTVGGDWEVLNLGHPGVDATRVRAVCEFALERLELDLLVVYTGHNELLPRYLSRRLAHHERPFATAVHGIASRLRVGRAVLAALGWEGQVALEDGYSDADGFAPRSRTAPVRPATRARYRRALEGIATAAARHDVPLVFVAPASNGIEYGPLASAHSRELTAEERRRYVGYLRAAAAALRVADLERAELELGRARELDPQVADLLHLAAALRRARGDMDGARELYHQAWDLDERPRACSATLLVELNEVARDRGVKLVDLATVMEVPVAPGERRLFVDNVHPSSFGQYLIAREIVVALTTDAASPAARERRVARLPRFAQLAPHLAGPDRLRKGSLKELARSDLGYAFFAFDPVPYVARAKERLSGLDGEEFADPALVVLDMMLALFEGDSERVLRRSDEARRTGQAEYLPLLERIDGLPRLRALLDSAGLERRADRLVRSAPAAGG